MKRKISGFSKLSKNEKIDWIIKVFFKNDISKRKILTNYWIYKNQFNETPLSLTELAKGMVPIYIKRKD